VADSAMLNTDNIALFDKGGVAEGFEYFVGDRLKNMSEAAIQHLTNLNNHPTVIIKDAEGRDLPLKYCTYQSKAEPLFARGVKSGQGKTRPNGKRK
jgi:hypothetical protein